MLLLLVVPPKRWWNIRSMGVEVIGVGSIIDRSGGQNKLTVPINLF